MPPVPLLAVFIQWRSSGLLSHTYEAYAPLTEAQTTDALCLSVPLLIASQLGVLTPRVALPLCSLLLDLLDGTCVAPPLPNGPLQSAKITMLKEGGIIVHTFEPAFGPPAEMDTEDAVAAFLINYVIYVDKAAPEHLSASLRSFILAGVKFYLESVEEETRGRTEVAETAHSMPIQMEMLKFSWSMSPRWPGTTNRFDTLVNEARTSLAVCQGRFAASVAKTDFRTTSLAVSPATSAPPTSSCELCGARGPTRRVEFYENVGALVMRFHRSIRASLCKYCIDTCFWNFTGKSMLLGWWGVISFIITPFIILNNVLRYAATIGMRKPDIRISRGPSPVWVLCAVGGFIAAGGLAWSVLFGIPSSSVPEHSAASRPTSVPAASSTALPVPRATPTPGCMPWNTVTHDSLGKTTCVYGYVNEIYTRMPFATVIRFGTDPADFFMVDTEYTYPDVGQGSCVKAIGQVQALNNRLYLDAGGALGVCD